MHPLNTIIMMVALYEMFHISNDPMYSIDMSIPPHAVCINEAIEIAKKFSDDAGKNLVHAVLANADRDSTNNPNIAPSSHTLFSV
jgi:transcription termination factor NusB